MEKLTKKAIKDELLRRIHWFEDSFGFRHEIGMPKEHNLKIHYGRYCALKDMHYQIENNLFIGGYVA